MIDSVAKAIYDAIRRETPLLQALKSCLKLSEKVRSCAVDTQVTAGAAQHKWLSRTFYSDKQRSAVASNLRSSQFP